MDQLGGLLVAPHYLKKDGHYLKTNGVYRKDENCDDCCEPAQGPNCLDCCANGTPNEVELDTRNAGLPTVMKGVFILRRAPPGTFYDSPCIWLYSTGESLFDYSFTLFLNNSLTNNTLCNPLIVAGRFGLSPFLEIWRTTPPLAPGYNCFDNIRLTCALASAGFMTINA